MREIGNITSIAMPPQIKPETIADLRHWLLLVVTGEIEVIWYKEYNYLKKLNKAKNRTV